MNKIEWYESTADIILDRIEEFYQTFYPKTTIENIGGSYRLQPCPMCGHSDCCTVGAAVHCFSGNCGWRGTHINAWYDYATTKLGKTLNDAIKELDQFTGLAFPINGEDFEQFKKHQTHQRILAEAEKFYHEKLLGCLTTYNFIDKESGQPIQLTPLQYLLNVRQRRIDTIKTYRMGFSTDYLGLYGALQQAGFSKEDIKDAQVWIPEGLFVFFYRHPVTKDIVRINTKNPFNIKRDIKNEFHETIDQKVIQGFSVGNKIPYFSNGFSFKKPFTVIEGEHDMFAILEHGCDNACCIGGNPSEDELRILEKSESTIFSATDNDEAGMKYLDILNTMFPHKDVRKIAWPDKYKDIDEYYVKGGYETKPWEQLCQEAILIVVDDEKFRILHDNDSWSIVNRHKRLDFKIDRKDVKGNLVGTVNYFIDGKITDRADDTSLVKCKAKMKPFNFYLADKIENYFNSNLEEKKAEELIDIYWYSAHKATIIKLLAKKLYETNSEDDTLLNKIKVKLRTPAGTDDVFDAILKEVNDIQNQNNKLSFSDIPRMRISQYFNVKNNDAYFYFINVKVDGDAKRKLPYLLRNDGQLIRLDLIKRKDEQCLLLVDNKYELPYEVQNAILDMRECSLTQEWVEKYTKKEIPDSELSPSKQIKDIENFLKKFYYTNEDDIYKVLSLYIYATYYYELFAQMPYLYINGEKGSGKSVLDNAIYLLAFNAKMAIDISDASLYRMVSMEGGTIILDEMENLTSRAKTADSTMASVLKGGYKRMGSIYRINKDEGNRSEGFDTYGPKVISNIFGLDDVIADRCIPISTYRLDVTPTTRMEDPKQYMAERLPEIRAVTSKCCLSALKNFMQLKTIFDTNLFVTGNARLSEILTPLLAMAKLVDIEEKEFLKQKYPEKSIHELTGIYETALLNFYTKSIKSSKEDIDINTPEGLIKRAVPQIAKELWGVIPLKDREYTVSENHKYQEEIKFNKEEGWFEINVVHFKCFIEENQPGEAIYTRIIPRWIKTCYKFEEGDMKRRTVHIKNEELLKEFKGSTNPKVNTYRFYFKDFIQNDFLSGERKTEDEQNKQAVKNTIEDKLF